MNDRYLFKAKRIDWRELPEKDCWVVGYYVPIKKKVYIICEAETSSIDGENTDFYATEWYEIDPFTLCRCTGLKDKNGTLIWENDVIYARCNGLSGKGVVKFENGCFVLNDNKRNRTYSLFGEWKFRVDGNVFDNTELPEVE